MQNNITPIPVITSVAQQPVQPKYWETEAECKQYVHRKDVDWERNSWLKK